ncbi:GAF and ANTAR domain-containing protein [Streptacidiphilus sp. PB12-B1b]|uniref:GAF and ANTAR domain-containing protein n=1 Tax=Streptacidiphilus sp. PB12-B1b TaxID=2705012 RepID=UPI0015FDD49A|nr:GAF and ANTAR domain-containing protein [Streptacidiphilus sp. PB12-B1b]QMU77201.1 GAF and ANTAR domain-containing protein [Streptacidiphilus sp. PB12-B1b]
MDEQLLARTFVELADNLVADFDLIDFFRLLTDRCVGVLGVSAAGVLLADRNGELRVMAASSEQARLLELFQLQNAEGPCLECFHTGAPVTVPDLTTAAERWPRFVAQAQSTGFTGVQALPMRLRDDVVGALNLFSDETLRFDPAALPLAQALADVATISLLQQRSTEVSTLLNEQLQTALNSRVLIEQAKGKLAERLDIDMEQAFTALRSYARSHQRRLSDLALAFVNGTEPLTDLIV